MSAKLQILLAVMAAVNTSFLQSSSNKFQSSVNSTFISDNERLFKPIIIPNITTFEEPNFPKTYETHKTKANEIVLKKVLQPQPQESTMGKNFSEKLRTNENFPKFSSRYSKKPEFQTEISPEETRVETTQIPERNASIVEKHNSFSDHSDNLSGRNEEEDTFRYEPREPERTDIVPTTNEPLSESQQPRNDPCNDDCENYETTSAAEQEEKDEDETKRYIHDYHNSGSKNYHSVQTPLSQVKYRQRHSYGDASEPEKKGMRLVSPISHHHIKYNWPHTKPQIKAELEKLNEISDSEESYEKELDEEIKEEVKAKPDLEFAVAKDELKFDKNKMYNIIEMNNLRKQLLKGLIAEEKKDDRKHILKQHQVDEEPRHEQNFKTAGESSGQPPANTPENTFKVKTPPSRKHKQFGFSNKVVTGFQGHEFLGPVVHNQNINKLKFKPTTKPPSNIILKTPTRNIFLDDLTEKKNLDQANLNNKKIQTWTSAHTQIFNHLEESDEMYNSILANIQSVFGLKTEPLKPGSNSKLSLHENKSLTWSSPFRKLKTV